MKTVCSHCLKTNRVPDERIDCTAKCGACGETLFSGQIIEATQQNFDTLLQDELPVVIDFWAPWCGPCVNFAPIFQEVAQEYSGRARFIKVNTEAQPALSAKFQIRSIPTLMVFKQGQRLDTLAGALPKGSFTQWLDSVLD